jgi:hypothetical protein
MRDAEVVALAVVDVVEEWATRVARTEADSSASLIDLMTMLTTLVAGKELSNQEATSLVFVAGRYVASELDQPALTAEVRRLLTA